MDVGGGLQLLPSSLSVHLIGDLMVSHVAQ